MRGHVVEAYPIRDITVGERYRRDLGDLSELCASIRDRGLLVPPTITADGVLVLGARRVAALTELGMAQTDVWVVEGVSDKLTKLLAMRDEIELGQPLKRTEEAALYRELLQIAKAAASDRRQLTQFGHHSQGDGGADSAPPSGHGKARQEAAHAVTGSNSYQRLEQVLAVQQLAGSGNAWLAEQAEHALEEIDRTGKVSAPFTAVTTLQLKTQLADTADDPDQPEARRVHAQQELTALTMIEHPHAALQYAKNAVKSLGAGPASDKRGWADLPPEMRERRHTARFMSAIDTLRAGWDEPEPHALASALTDEQWATVQEFNRRLSDLVSVVGALRAGSTPA